MYLDLSSWDIQIESPYYSEYGFRSNISTTYSSFTDHKPVNLFGTVASAAGHDFAKLNVSDSDATSSIFDPSDNTGHKIIPEDAYGSFEGYMASAKNSFDHGCNSRQNVISITFNGDPGHVGHLLKPEFIANFSISFSNDGIQTTINWADRPSKPPSMDYFGSKFHQIKFYK